MIGILDAALIASLGYGVVFGGLIALMVVVIIIGKIFQAKKQKETAPAEPVTVEPVVPAESQLPVAPGSAGKLKIYDVPPKTAAMLMAIVADTMGKPLNELRFISIKEVK